MSRRPLWISAVLFAALLVLTLQVMRGRRSPEAESYFGLKQRVPDTLSVVYGPDTTVIVPGGESGWRIIRPVDFPADAVVIDAMLKRLADLQVGERRFPLSPEKMDTYGMRYPRSVIRAAYGDGLSPDTLVVGAFSMNGAYDYVRAGSADEVALLDARVARSYFFKTSDEFRRSRLMPFHEGRAVGLTLVGPDGRPTVVLSKRPDGSWWVESPYPGPGASKEITEYFTSLSHMHIETYVRDTPGPFAPYGLDPPHLAARVRLASGDSLEADLGGPVPGEELVYAGNAGRPYVFGVSTKYPPVFEVPDGYFRQRGVVPFGLIAVDSVRVTAGSRSITVDPGVRSADHRPFRDAAGNWLLLEAEDFRRGTAPALKRAGLVPGRGTITWFGAGDTLAVVRVGAAADDMVALRVESGAYARPGEILFVDERRAAPLWKALSTFDPAAGSS